VREHLFWIIVICLGFIITLVLFFHAKYSVKKSWKDIREIEKRIDENLKGG